MKLLWAALWAAAITMAPSAHAQNWARYALISPTTTLSAGRVCYTDGIGIACDTTAPLLSGLAASGDRITSGTSSVFVANNGAVSVTIAGTPVANFGSGGMGITAINASGAVVASGVSVTGTVSATTLFLAGQAGGAGISFLSTLDRIISGTSSVFVQNNGVVSITIDSTPVANFGSGGMGITAINASGLFSGAGVSLSAPVTGTLATFTRSLGIGTAAPTVSLSVIGEVQVSNSNVTCGATTAGAIRYTGGNLQYCNGSAFTSLSSNTVAGFDDRIISGTTSVVAADSGPVSITIAGSNVANFGTGGLGITSINASGLITASGGISTTAISATSGLFTSDNFSIRTTTASSTAGMSLRHTPSTVGLQFIPTAAAGNYNPIVLQGDSVIAYQAISQNLGRLSIVPWANTAGGLRMIGNGMIAMGGLITPTTSLEVSGTISATNFVGNGSGLTGLTSGDRITSGTSSVFVQNNGVVSVTIGGTPVANFGSGGLGITSINASGGISTSGPISGTTGYFSRAITSRGVDNGSGTSIDFSQGNVQYTNAACGAFTLSGTADGGSYSLVVKGSGAGPATFTHTGLTVQTTGTLTCTTGSHTVFSFMRAGTDLYVTYITGY